MRLRENTYTVTWFSLSKTICLHLTTEHAKIGQSLKGILHLLDRRFIKRQIEPIPPHVLKAELRAYEVWDSVELEDHEKNQQRLLYLACTDVYFHRNPGGRMKLFLALLIGALIIATAVLLWISPTPAYADPCWPSGTWCLPQPGQRNDTVDQWYKQYQQDQRDQQYQAEQQRRDAQREVLERELQFQQNMQQQQLLDQFRQLQQQQQLNDIRTR